MTEEKTRCPDCGSTNTKKKYLPYGDEEYIFCEDCKRLSTIIRVKIDAKKTQKE